MTRPDDATKAANGQSSRAEGSDAAKKRLDPSHYQVSTLPAQVRSEYQKLPLHRYSEEELKPPPGYGGTPPSRPNTAPSSETAPPAVTPTPAAPTVRRWLPIVAAVLLAGFAAAWFALHGKPSTPEASASCAATTPSLAAASRQTEATAAAQGEPATKAAETKDTVPPKAIGTKAVERSRSNLSRTQPAASATQETKNTSEKVVNIPLLDR
ncbi:MAG: hypothetical protein QM784_30255 [Polyangiaceae bacterium]